MALLTGASVRWLTTRGDRVGFDVTCGGGLLGILASVTGMVLPFIGRHPTALFDLIVGFNRWFYRTIAYVALMTDTYPPFQLDQGGCEPDPAPTTPTGTPPPAAQSPIDESAEATPPPVRARPEVPA